MDSLVQDGDELIIMRGFDPDDLGGSIYATYHQIAFKLT